MISALRSPARFAEVSAAPAAAELSSIACDLPAPGRAVRELGASLHRHRLLLQFAVVNLAAFALLALAHLQGWTTIVIAADDTYLTPGIFLAFLCGLFICAKRVQRVSAEMNAALEPTPRRGSWAAGYLAEVEGRESGSRGIAIAGLRAKVLNRLAVVRHFASNLVLLGLIGTVLGFIIALGGVDPKSAGDVRAITPMVTELIRGMSVALYTTLVGAILNIWLMVNYHLLAAGAARLVSTIVARGESRAHS